MENYKNKTTSYAYFDKYGVLHIVDKEKTAVEYSHNKSVYKAVIDEASGYPVLVEDNNYRTIIIKVDKETFKNIVSSEIDKSVNDSTNIKYDYTTNEELVNILKGLGVSL